MMLIETIRLLHLWLGLSSRIVVFSIKGCLYNFQEEVQNAAQPFRYVDARQAAFLQPSKLQTTATMQRPGKDLQAVMYSGLEKKARKNSAVSAVQSSVPRKTPINYPLRTRT